MNDAILERLAAEIAQETILKSWPFYLLLLLISFIGTVAGSYFRARFAKHGDVAATKADAQDIVMHLERTTNATKAIELSLAHGDWIKKESNSLKRAKLEQLVVAAFAIAASVSEASEALFQDEKFKDSAPIDEFEMLAQLYFSELSPQIYNVVRTYRESRLTFSPIRQSAMALKAAMSFAKEQGDVSTFVSLLSDMKNLMDSENANITEKTFAVYKAARDLATDGYGVMAQLTVPTLSSNQQQ